MAETWRALGVKTGHQERPAAARVTHVAAAAAKPVPAFLISASHSHLGLPQFCNLWSGSRAAVLEVKSKRSSQNYF